MINFMPKDTNSIINYMPYFSKITQSEVVFPKEIQFTKSENQIQIRKLNGGCAFFRSEGVDIFITKDEIKMQSLNTSDSMTIVKSQIKDIYIEREIVKISDRRYLYYNIKLVLNESVFLMNLNEKDNVISLLNYSFQSVVTPVLFMVQEILNMLQIKNGNTDVNFINFSVFEENNDSLILKKKPFLGYCFYGVIIAVASVFYCFMQDPIFEKKITIEILIGGEILAIIVAVIAAFLNMGLYLSVNRNQIQFAKILPWGLNTIPKKIMTRPNSYAKACEINYNNRVDIGNDIGWFEVRLFPDSYIKKSKVIASGISCEEAEHVAYAINRIIKGEPMDNRYIKKFQ